MGIKMQWKPRVKNKKENELEQDIRRFAERRGWLWMKFVSPGYAGVTDRIGIRRGRVIFLEVKKEGEVPRELQKEVHEEMRRYGAEVFWVDSLEEAMEILR